MARAKKDFYLTWQEALVIILQLGIKNSTQYNKQRDQDPRLPSKLYDYPGFPGWPDVLTALTATELMWYEMYIKLSIYKKEHKNCKVTQKHDPALSKWVTAQRKDLQKDVQAMTDEQVMLLEQLGFQW